MKEQETVTVTGKQLLDIYLDGFVSGVCSTLNTFSPLADNQIMHIAQHLADGMCQSKADVAMLYNEIQERLDGEDSGPKLSTVPLFMGKIPFGPEAN